MPLLKIENEIKKNVIEVETWINEELQLGVDIETGWRFVEYTIDVTEEEAAEIDSENKHGFIITDYQIEDMSSSDSFSFSFNEVWRTNNEPLTQVEHDAIIAELESIWEEDGWSGLENCGWDHHNTETFMYGPLIIEEVK